MMMMYEIKPTRYPGCNHSEKSKIEKKIIKNKIEKICAILISTGISAIIIIILYVLRFRLREHTVLTII